MVSDLLFRRAFESDSEVSRSALLRQVLRRERDLRRERPNSARLLGDPPLPTPWRTPPFSLHHYLTYFLTLILFFFFMMASVLLGLYILPCFNFFFQKIKDSPEAQKAPRAYSVKYYFLLDGVLFDFLRDRSRVSNF